MENAGVDNNVQSNMVNFQARLVMEEMKGLLNRVHAQMDVSRDKIRSIVKKGHDLVEESEIWPGGQAERDQFLQILEGLEKQISTILDYRMMEDMGLVRAVRFK